MEAVRIVELGEFFRQCTLLERTQITAQCGQVTGGADAVLIENGMRKHESDSLFKGEQNFFAVGQQRLRTISHPLETGQCVDVIETFDGGH